MESVLIAVGVVALIGLILGGLIGFVAKKFAVASDPRIEEVTELLPGANCGDAGMQDAPIWRRRLSRKA